MSNSQKSLIIFLVAVLIGGYFVFDYKSKNNNQEEYPSNQSQESVLVEPDNYDYNEPVVEIEPVSEKSDPVHQEIARAIKTKNGSDQQVYVHFVSAGYAKGGAGGEDGPGYSWLAKQTGETWTVIAQGNETWSCKTMDELGVPLEVYRVCFDYQNGGAERRFKE